MKKLTYIFLITVFILLCASPAFADETYQIWLNGKPSNIQPYYEDGYVYVPIAQIIQMEGGEAWLDDANLNVVRYDDHYDHPAKIPRTKIKTIDGKLYVTTGTVNRHLYPVLQYPADTNGPARIDIMAARNSYYNMRTSDKPPLSRLSDHKKMKEIADRLGMAYLDINVWGNPDRIWYNTTGLSADFADVSAWSGDYKMVINLLAWENGVPEKTKEILKTYLPTGGDRIYEVVNGFYRTSLEKINNRYIVDGCQITFQYAPAINQFQIIIRDLKDPELVKAQKPVKQTAKKPVTKTAKK